METLTEYMAREHRACDGAFAAAEADAAAGDLDKASHQMLQFISDMERHFKREEEVLFPSFEQRTGHTQGPTQIMRREHEQMRRMFRDLEAALSAGDKERLLGLTDTLLILMQQHNAKEEQILYPMADQALADQVIDLTARFAEI
jgi:hemerythrin-like domain-containing protein